MNLKEGTIRLSQNCPIGCKEVGCTEIHEKRTIFGKTRNRWWLQCKYLKKIEGGAMRIFKKL